MKKLKLNHVHTPNSLAEINGQLELVLNGETLDDNLLKELIENRDLIVVSHLNGLAGDIRKTFAEHELVSNQLLSNVINKHLRSSLKQLSGLLRGRKAVNKYK